jgi:hypothetical protein
MKAVILDLVFVGEKSLSRRGLMAYSAFGWVPVLAERFTLLAQESSTKL